MRLSLLQKQENAHDDSLWACAWAPGSNTLVGSCRGSSMFGARVVHGRQQAPVKSYGRGKHGTWEFKQCLRCRQIMHLPEQGQPAARTTRTQRHLHSAQYVAAGPSATRLLQSLAACVTPYSAGDRLS